MTCKWTNKELIECSEYIMYFLIEASVSDTFDTPAHIEMRNHLDRYDTHMVDFTKFLNKKLHISTEPLWRDSAKEFFSNHNKVIPFFEKAIIILSRKEKLEHIITKINESVQYR